MALLAPKGSRYDFEKDATGVNVFLRVRLGE
jgi:hypothetical protein